LNNRFYSLDVFRGATVAFMILVNNPGSWRYIFSPLKHAPWHGCTPTDLVFPFFLFAVGNALAFVMPKLEQAGTATFLKKVFKRALLIFGIGLLLHWIPFIRWEENALVFKSLDNIRIFGVLQRIALCYLFASLLIYFLKAKGALAAGIAILLVYWILCLVLGNPADPYSLEGFWGTHVDRQLLGYDHIYMGEGVPFDPEGLASTLPAIVNVIAGYLAGRYIKLHFSKPVVDGNVIPAAGVTAKSYAVADSAFRVLTHLFIAGSLLIFAGLCWDLAFPINKKIWTSSYVLYTSGLALTVLALVMYILEVRKWTGVWSRFFDVFGKNPLFIYVLSGFVPRVLGLVRIPDRLDDEGQMVYLTPFGWFYEYVCKPVSDNQNVGSLLYAICLVTLYWFIGYLLDRRKIYIRV
jgi:predicted acyltransferase